ncbi:MAG: anti-sigma factor [Proteobacteria bacterium]|nr:anti-sigma factor [Pseudomonadota bacterium]
MPLAEGISTKPLRFAGEERTQLLKVEPGVSVGLHSHGGYVHAFALSGSRLLDGQVIAGPGSYAFEPSGNRDCWKCTGNEPVILFIHMAGALVSFDAQGKESGRTTTEGLRQRYVAWCGTEGHPPVAIGARQ